MSAPKHALARGVYDDEGRLLSFGLSEAEIRLECVRLVHDRVHRPVDSPLIKPDDVIRVAGVLAAFVLGTGAPADGPVPDRSQYGRVSQGAQGFRVEDVLGNRLVDQIKAHGFGVADAKAEAPQRPVLSPATELAARQRLIELESRQASAEAAHAEHTREAARKLDIAMLLAAEARGIRRDLGEPLPS